MSAPAAAAPAPAQARRAGFVSRLAAFVVDAILLAVALRGVFWFLFGAQHAWRGFARQLNVSRIVFASVPFVTAAYDVVLWRLYGQTLGKWLMGIKVVPVHGGRMSTMRALARFAGYVLSAIPCYAGFLWMLGPSRRGWHDRLARTEVVYVARQPQLAGGEGGISGRLPEPSGA
jgi:uncharacterized RDD family membrane protein YckC